MSANRHGADAALILELAKGRTLIDAAQTAGVSESTARRRWADPVIRAKVEAAQDEMVGTALRTLAATSEAAALTLRDLLSRKTADSTRLQAASKILDAVRSRDQDARLAKIEETLFPKPADVDAPMSITSITKNRG